MQVSGPLLIALTNYCFVLERFWILSVVGLNPIAPTNSILSRQIAAFTFFGVFQLINYGHVLQHIFRRYLFQLYQKAEAFYFFAFLSTMNLRLSNRMPPL